jgi:hypothetical protein
MMPRFVFYCCFLCFGLLSCGEKEKKRGIEKIEYIQESDFQVDTVVWDDVQVKYRLAKVKDAFVAVQQQGSSGMQLHLYLEVSFLGSTYTLEKSAFGKEINRDFLDEARLEQVVLDHYDPDRKAINFRLYIRKPLEDEGFPGSWTISESINIIELPDE